MNSQFPAFLNSGDDLNVFLEGFWSGTFPGKQWTHGAHVAMAACVLWSEPIRIALPMIRDGIRAYNVAQGGQNTPTSGYHETLTRLWIGAVAAFLATLPADIGRLEAAQAAYARFAGSSSMFKPMYSFDLVKSEQARAEWVAPDAGPFAA